VADLRQHLSAEEFAHWLAYDRDNPLSLERGDIHAAQIVAAHAGGRISDHLPRWGEPDTPDAALERLLGG